MVCLAQGAGNDEETREKKLMCLAVPMRIAEIAHGTAICEVDGVRREASLMMLEDVTVGDYVLIHAGFALEKVDPVEAQKTLDIFREVLNAGGGAEL